MIVPESRLYETGEFSLLYLHCTKFCMSFRGDQTILQLDILQSLSVSDSLNRNKYMLVTRDTLKNSYRTEISSWVTILQYILKYKVYIPSNSSLYFQLDILHNNHHDRYSDNLNLNNVLRLRLKLENFLLMEPITKPTFR